MATPSSVTVDQGFTTSPKPNIMNSENTVSMVYFGLNFFSVNSAMLNHLSEKNS